MTTKSRREITRADIMPLADYAAERPERRRAITELKRRRRLEVGPCATFSFENYDTMWQQVQEMLYIEKGGEAQVTDELEAYNPLIPNGRELVATIMFEIDDPARRARELARLGGIENTVFLEFGGERIPGEADPTRENTSPDGKASSVQFIRFGFSAGQIKAFRAQGTRVIAGFDHPNYGHQTVMPDAVREALSEDFE